MSTSFISVAAEKSPPSIIPAKNSAACSKLLMESVGEFSRGNISDDELEAHIRDLGKLTEQAYAEGDPAGARIWSARMVEAINHRSPAKRAEMTAAIDKRIDELTFFGVWAHELVRLS